MVNPVTRCKEGGNTEIRAIEVLRKILGQLGLKFHQEPDMFYCIFITIVNFFFLLFLICYRSSLITFFPNFESDICSPLTVDILFVNLQ